MVRTSLPSESYSPIRSGVRMSDRLERKSFPSGLMLAEWVPGDRVSRSVGPPGLIW